MRAAGDKRFVVRKSISEKSLNIMLLLLILKTNHRRCSVKKVLLKICKHEDLKLS